MRILDILKARKLGYQTLHNTTDMMLAKKVSGGGQVEITTDTAPYVYRATPVQNAFKAKMHKIVGASVVWNQLVQNGNFASINGWYSTNFDMSIPNNTLELTSTANTGQYVRRNLQLEKDHVYLGFLTFKADTSGHKLGVSLNNNTIYTNTLIPLMEIPTTYTTILGICKLTKQDHQRDSMNINTASANPIPNGEKLYVKNVHCHDLTAMFGTTIADYVYTLEQATAGSGIAWLQSYGFFTEDYYAYKQNKLESVCVSAHKTYDGETLLTNTELSPITLRGLFKLSTDKLTVDGDEYNADGSVTRKYEQRAYQSGDESLANAITDGTNTIVKLATPTTEQTTPFTETEIVGSTEEFIDYEVAQSNRDVAIPVGHETDYYVKVKN